MAYADSRPRRKYYEITPAGRHALAEAVQRYRALQPAREPHVAVPKPARG